MKLTWKRKTARHSNGEDLYIGRWVVGSVNWSSLSRSMPNYDVTCLLPGIKTYLPGNDSIEEAKKTLERAVGHWFSNLDEEAS